MKREHSSATIVGEDGTTATSIAQKSIRRYMFLLKNACPQEELGKNYKMKKFHQTLHLVPLIARHGSLRNTDSSHPESMEKGNVKAPASHTQKVTSVLLFQTGKRYMESLTFLKSEMGLTVPQPLTSAKTPKSEMPLATVQLPTTMSIPIFLLEEQDSPFH
jgi:hypothetical protein